MMDRFRFFSLFFAAIWIILSGYSSSAQLPGSSLIPSATQMPSHSLQQPSLNVEAGSQVQEQVITVGEPFHFLVNASWDGDTALVSLSEPKIEWPKAVRQLDVSTGVRSQAGASKPRGSRYFRYTLAADKAGPVTLPAVHLEVTQEGKAPLSVASPEVGITVREKEISFLSRLQSQIKKNSTLLAGSLLVVVLGCGVFFFNRRKNPPEIIDQPDPWVNIASELKSIEPLILAGEGRDFFRAVEKVLCDAVSLHQGSSSSIALNNIGQQALLPDPVRDTVQRLASEIQERKYRPDRPRPEELSVALGQLKEIIKQLKDIKPGGGLSK